MIYVLEVQDSSTGKWEYREQSSSRILLMERKRRQYANHPTVMVRPVTDVQELASLTGVPRYCPVTGKVQS